jgi:UPF0755 protein
VTFYDQDDPDRPIPAAGPPAGGPDGGPAPDPDIWSTADPEAPAPRPRGPRRPGRPGAAVAAPSTGEVQIQAQPQAQPQAPAYQDGAQDLAHDDGHDWVEIRHTSTRTKVLVTLGVLAVVALVVGGLAWRWYRQQVDPPGEAGATIAVVVPEGASTSRVGDLLEAQGIIPNGTVFSFYAERHGLHPIVAGTYRLQENSDLDLVIGRLNAGPSSPATVAVTKVTIPEGWTIARILRRIHEKVPRLSVADLQAALDQGKVPSGLKPPGTRSYEGLLFPATYEVPDDATAVDVLTMMSEEMEQRVDDLGLAAAQERIKAGWGLDLSGYDLLKVASMIQYEAATEADAPKIGTVTYNRLRAGMALGYDSTSIYEAGLSGKGPGDIDFTVDTPYNTRTHAGLPPTPISAPGEYALEGAMEPASGDWLYFVLTDTKQVTFAVTYQEFLDAKQQCKERGLGCG